MLWFTRFGNQKTVNLGLRAQKKGEICSTAFQQLQRDWDVMPSCKKTITRKNKSAQNWGLRERGVWCIYSKIVQFFYKMGGSNRLALCSVKCGSFLRATQMPIRQRPTARISHSPALWLLLWTAFASHLAHSLLIVCSHLSHIWHTFVSQQGARQMIHTFCFCSALLTSTEMCWTSALAQHIFAEDCIRTLPRGGMYWVVHPRRPRDFPRPKRCPKYLYLYLYLYLYVYLYLYFLSIFLS